MKTVAFTTAQYVSIDYEIAPTLYRVLGALVDLIGLIIYFLVANIFIDSFSMDWSVDALSSVSAILIRIPWFLYSPVIEYLTNGRSLGKLAVGIRVVNESGETAGLRAYFTRWIFRVIDIWLGGFGGLAVLLAGTSEKGQRLGDRMAGTVVIRNKSSRMYTLKSLLSMKSQSTHTIQYAGVTRFTDEDMLLIKNSIQRVQRFPSESNNLLIKELALKTAQLIEIEPPKQHLSFLQTVLQDYVVLTR